MILAAIAVYVCLCAYAYYIWHDFIIAPESLKSKEQRPVKSKALRVILRLSMLLFGPLWFAILIIGIFYYWLKDSATSLWESLIK